MQDYYPGGSIMPGRSFNAGDYRYGYQGSEKDDEITGVEGAHITTHFRELDTRLLRWWSVDPKAALMPWESPYMSMGGNPIWLNDPYGDTWDVADNDDTKKDVGNLTESSENNKYVTFNETDKEGVLNVTLDFKDADRNALSEEKINDILANDEGLSLIRDLVDSEKKMYYESSNMPEVGTEWGGTIHYLITMDNNGVLNLSWNGKNANGETPGASKGGYDGELYISASGMWYEDQSAGIFGVIEMSKPRIGVIYHELVENMLHSEGMDYEDAHLKANLREDRRYGNKGGKSPGHAKFRHADQNLSRKEVIKKYSK